MFRLAVAVIEGEESRIRESLEGTEGRSGGGRTQNGRRKRRGQKNRSRSHGIEDSRTDGQSRPLAVRIKRHKDGGTVIFSDPEGLWQRINDQDI